MKGWRSGLRAGDVVWARQERWRIAETRSFQDCEWLCLIGTAAGNRGEQRLLLFSFDRPRRCDVPTAPKVVRRLAWMRTLAGLTCEAAPDGGLRTAWHARIELAPFQLEPALAVVRGRASRLLLADEVGLGKTIQAGLLLAELRARGEADRALVLTPSGLRDSGRRS